MSTRGAGASLAVAIIGAIIALLAWLYPNNPTNPSPPTAIATPSESAPLTDLTGHYVIDRASNPGSGSSYTGEVTITRDGQLHRLSWTIPNTAPYIGVGLVEGNTLAVGYGTAAKCGITVYRISGGTLTGRWANGSTISGTPGTETLVGPVGLNGQYNSRGRQPDGTGYTGTAQIVPTGATYAVTRTIAGTTFSGIGIREGDLLVVGWSMAGSLTGVVNYRVNSSTLEGQWAFSGGTAIGTEVLRRW